MTWGGYGGPCDAPEPIDEVDAHDLAEHHARLEEHGAERCPWCQGTGDGRGREPCWQCVGTAYVTPADVLRHVAQQAIARAEERRAAERAAAMVPCPRCKGSGEAGFLLRCGACDGIGRVAPAVVAEMREVTP